MSKGRHLSDTTIALRLQGKAYRVWIDLNSVIYTDDTKLAYSFGKEVTIVKFDWEKMKPI